MKVKTSNNNHTALSSVDDTSLSSRLYMRRNDTPREYDTFTEEDGIDVEEAYAMTITRENAQ
ncbi:MAG: hypothetical protein Q9181_005617 [Wetmoreana brouardii]